MHGIAGVIASELDSTWLFTSRPRHQNDAGSSSSNTFHAILGAEPYRQAQGSLTCCLLKVGSGVLNPFRLEIALPSTRRTGWPRQRADRWT